MKRIIALLLAFVTFSCTSNAQKTKFSKEALSETLLATDGSQVAFKDILKQYKGKTLVIEVWASWCGDCVKAMPKLKELQDWVWDKDGEWEENRQKVIQYLIKHKSYPSQSKDNKEIIMNFNEWF